MSLYHINITVHILAAFLWLGGLFFFGAVGAPVLRRVEPASLRKELFRQIGEQSRRVGWVAIAVLLVTGVLNLHFRGLLTWDVLGRASFWDGSYGTALAVKLFSVLGLLIGSAIHDFVIGPAAGRADPDSDEALRLRRLSAWTGRINALLGVVLIVAAVVLTRGI